MRATVVVKLGSSTIVDEDGRPRLEIFDAVAGSVAAAAADGARIAVVSSGAIALGAARARLPDRRHRTLAQQQAASALGQAALQHLWQDAFARRSLLAAQVLLTASDITERRPYLNVRAALTALFDIGAIPVLNENDATSTDEIGFSDNDILAAQVAVLLRARTLVLISNVEGVLEQPPGNALARVLADGDDVVDAVFGAPSAVGRGGIASKVAAARLASAGGVEAFVTSPAMLPDVLAGTARGTRFAPQAVTESAFKLWLRHGNRPTSRIEIDDGAVVALAEHGASLLAVGVRSWTAGFRRGDGVEIVDGTQRPIARGIASVDSWSIAGRPVDVEVVHRNNLVLLPG